MYWFERIEGVQVVGYSLDFIITLIANFNRNNWRKLEDGKVIAPGLNWVYAKKIEGSEDVGVYFSNENRLLGYIRRGSPPPGYNLKHPEIDTNDEIGDNETT